MATIWIWINLDKRERLAGFTSSFGDALWDGAGAEFLPMVLPQGPWFMNRLVCIGNVGDEPDNYDAHVLKPCEREEIIAWGEDGSLRLYDFTIAKFTPVMPVSDPVFRVHPSNNPFALFNSTKKLYVRADIIALGDTDHLNGPYTLPGGTYDKFNDHVTGPFRSVRDGLFIKDLTIEPISRERRPSLGDVLLVQNSWADDSNLMWYDAPLQVWKGLWAGDRVGVGRIDVDDATQGYTDFSEEARAMIHWMWMELCSRIQVHTVGLDLYYIHFTCPVRLIKSTIYRLLASLQTQPSARRQDEKMTEVPHGR